MTIKEKILSDNSQYYFSPSQNEEKEDLKQALVFVPDLSLNGAQTVLFTLIKILNDLNFKSTIISSEEGIDRDKYLSIGCAISIRSQVYCSEELKEFLCDNFDLVLMTLIQKKF